RRCCARPSTADRRMPSAAGSGAYIGRVGTPELSVVIPAYNEGQRLATTLRALADATAAYDVETIVVDDGSRDDTAAIARAILDEQPRGSVIRFDVNRGKGAAVRAGVLASTGAAVLYMDADLAT